MVTNDNSELKGFGVAILSLFIRVINFLSFERALGTALLIYAFLVAFEPLRNGSTLNILIQTTGLNYYILSTWYLLSSVYVLAKGRSISFWALLICIFPFQLEIIGSLLFSFQNINASYIAREVFVQIVILQSMLKRIAIDTIQAANIKIDVTKEL